MYRFFPKYRAGPNDRRVRINARILNKQLILKAGSEKMPPPPPPRTKIIP